MKTRIIFMNAYKPFFGLKFFEADPGWNKLGSGMEKFGSGINIPYLQQ
jgi:hypothetical protein